MKIRLQKVKLINKSVEDECEFFEKITRISHKSEERIKENCCLPFLKKIYELKHFFVFEHVYYTFHIITNMAIANEITKHRIASFIQESARYINYKNGIEIILPYHFKKYLNALIDGSPYRLIDFIDYGIDIDRKITIKESEELTKYLNLMLRAEEYYKSSKLKAQEKRGILPLDLKTELYMTINLRSLMNFFRLKLNKSAHIQMREIAYKMYKEIEFLKELIK